MISDKENYNQFYKILGQLFYLVAAVDRTVRPEEFEQFRQSMKVDWIPLDPNSAQIEIAFNESLRQVPKRKDCLEAFQLFKLENENLFTDEIRVLIWKTASLVADVIGGKNKSELVILSQIFLILKN